MQFLVGLGNPGRKYLDTKHNVGFWVLDRFAEKRSLAFQAGKGDYLFAKKDDLLCLKPTSYMNNSGEPLSHAIQFFKAKHEDILVIYDDIDLQFGNIKFRKGGGSGGHRGIESIIYQLRSKDFNRLRIGIATDEEMRPSEQYVLTPFNKKDEVLKNEIIDKACDGIEYFLTYELTETMNQFNKKRKG